MPSPQWLVAGSCTAGVTGLPKNLGAPAYRPAAAGLGAMRLLPAGLALDHGIEQKLQNDERLAAA